MLAGRCYLKLIATDPGDNLTLVESSFKTGQSGDRLVTGTVRNNTDHSYSHVQVDISLLDEHGSVVENTVASTNDLGAGQAWYFEVPIRAEDAVRAILDGQCGRRYYFHGEGGGTILMETSSQR